MGLVRFYAAVLRIALVLAVIGSLKSCTRDVLGLSAVTSERGMISYEKFSGQLVN